MSDAQDRQEALVGRRGEVEVERAAKRKPGVLHQLRPQFSIRDSIRRDTSIRHLMRRPSDEKGD